MLSAPGVFEDYPQIDRARRRLASRFEQQFRENGYELLGYRATWARPASSRRTASRRPADSL
ncbi:MAG: hypothetical protein R3B99_29420 [Polyangiales bacterium]